MVMQLPTGLADLHRHLDGSLRPTTVTDFAQKKGLDVPLDLLFYKGMGLQQALARFAFTLGLLDTPDAVRRVAAEICEDAINDGVSTLEIRFAPQLHDARTPERFVEAALEGIDSRAGLILCGLYGEEPTMLKRLVRIGANQRGVVGLDLAGGPAPIHQWGLSDYEQPFLLAKEAGLGRTVHAAEGRSPKEIRTAITLLNAQRIGHGTTLLDDQDIVELVLEKQVTIEACPTSNVHTGVIPAVTGHPLPYWLDKGIRACVNTDNTLLSDVQQSEELRKSASIPGMSLTKITQANNYGHSAAFPKTRALLTR